MLHRPDHNGQALAYVYFEDEPGRRAAPSCSPATRPGASPPTSPSCQICCDIPRVLMWTLAMGGPSSSRNFF